MAKIGVRAGKAAGIFTAGCLPDQICMLCAEAPVAEQDSSRACPGQYFFIRHLEP